MLTYRDGIKGISHYCRHHIQDGAFKITSNTKFCFQA